MKMDLRDLHFDKLDVYLYNAGIWKATLMCLSSPEQKTTFCDSHSKSIMTENNYFTQ